MAPLTSVFIHFLSGSKNEPNAVREVLQEYGTLRPHLKLDDENVEFIVGNCEPEVGQYVEGQTEVIVGDQTLNVFKRIHVCCYKDTFMYNFDRMRIDYIEPYFNTQQRCEFKAGFEFSQDGKRFHVVAVDPADSLGVVGKDTIIFFEDHIERDVLESLQVLPYETGLPDKYRPTKLSLDEQGLLRDYLKPYFEQRSAGLKRTEVLEIDGVKFKIIGMKPDPGDKVGGGVGKDTVITCKGVALRESFEPKAKAASSKAKAKAKGKAAAAKAGPPAPDQGQSHSGDGGSSGNGNCTIS
mmetsp:Transcript_5232/g.11359  ORF Transcript_5232/g.11359 Transcript_5232/m.11359 type:complete len:296 (+) Transcript_5232:182-1069(+)|eukprot:CAMPEP_0206593178 /NCGR_PEP_ID=MMETSP0325_2-20121206/41483_1 /ASSEMBLY_ACC=CAM_ASM_000347 /TAXON_ID=2866 /ORGANISM="Crypthecodinium cohnii, Strain Seligo" /LENGTH=295 /DNA_ID=CAMNT_0054103117 /DNA_START=90 /DNA_END=974 /DNA_ORIENTATION=+